jgi:hypothetical protein
VTPARVTGTALMACGGGLAALPAFVWYSAPPAGDPTVATGFAAAGQLWLLPVLGAVIVVAGAALLVAPAGGAGPVARWSGPLVAGAALLALGLALWAAIDPSVVLTLGAGAAAERIAVRVDLEPAGVITPVLAGLLAAVGAVVAWTGWRR